MPTRECAHIGKTNKSSSKVVCSDMPEVWTESLYKGSSIHAVTVQPHKPIEAISSTLFLFFNYVTLIKKRCNGSYVLARDDDDNPYYIDHKASPLELSFNN